MSDRPRLLSRRDALRHAAGALALGCAAPRALAAPLAPETPLFRLSIFAPDGSLVQTLRLSDNAGRTLRDAGALGSITFQSVDGEVAHTHATFALRTG